MKLTYHTIGAVLGFGEVGGGGGDNSFATFCCGSGGNGGSGLN